MLRFASDENFNNDLLRRLWRLIPTIDIVRVQDVGLTNTLDTLILEWAATENRILLTHDLRTIPKFAYERINKGLTVAGVFAINEYALRHEVTNDLVIIVECSSQHEWINTVTYLPYK